jgi:hypothetical protein
MSGVLLTCGTHVEPKAVREGFELLNAAWDALAEARAAPADGADAASTAPPDDDDGPVFDVAAQIAREAASLKKGKRFYVAQADCPGFVVLRANPAVQPHPPMLALANAICAAAAARGAAAVGPGSRYIARLLPCQAVCRAELEWIAAAAGEVVAAEAARRPPGAPPWRSFAVQFRQRYNGALERDEVVATVATAVAAALGAGARVCIGDPEVCVSIEVVRKLCCVCVTDSWLRLKKYSLVNLRDEGRDADGGADADGADAPAAAPAGAAES